MLPAGDGRRFLMKVPIEGTTPPSITVVLNWTAGLRSRGIRKVSLEAEKRAGQDYSSLVALCLQTAPLPSASRDYVRKTS